LFIVLPEYLIQSLCSAPLKKRNCLFLGLCANRGDLKSGKSGVAGGKDAFFARNIKNGMIRTNSPALLEFNASHAALRSVSLPGPVGRLEALVNEGSPDAPFAALVCHPHPLGCGNLHNKVVYRAMKALNDPAWGLGWPVLRFNFRGTGLSQGVHDGEAEAGDVRAALDWLEREYRRPLVVVGFSFGAVMAISACCPPCQSSASVRALALLGLPIHAEGRDYHYSFLDHCRLPKLFLSGASDLYAPAAQLAEVVASASEPKSMVLLPRADHFFSGQLEPMQSALNGWLKEQLP
jgi:alpha/beta superfamily hydrolase